MTTTTNPPATALFGHRWADEQEELFRSLFYTQTFAPNDPVFFGSAIRYHSPIRPDGTLRKYSIEIIYLNPQFINRVPVKCKENPTVLVMTTVWTSGSITEYDGVSKSYFMPADLARELWNLSVTNGFHAEKRTDEYDTNAMREFLSQDSFQSQINTVEDGCDIDHVLIRFNFRKVVDGYTK
jgi:hypothetical protein